MKLQAHILCKRYAHGMTLIEVLIAAVVIAVGLLGIASLQVNALQGASEAQYRAKAADVIASLANRLQANLGGVASYEDTIPTESCALAADATLSTIERCAMSPDGPVGVVSQCTQAEMAAYDLWEVNCSLQNNIPGAQLSITCPAPGCATMNPMTVTISWQVQNRNPDAATAAQNFTTHEVVATILPGVPTL
ncbi:MAG: type IV pilus modification protein PilV [Candidatus Thiodiazotropha endolucinida]